MAENTPKRKHSPRLKQRYGIGEWYGKLFARMTTEERRSFAEEAVKRRTDLNCIWRTRRGQVFKCSKRGGVCSLRLYRGVPGTGEVQVAPSVEGELCATCPERFYEGGMIFDWIGEHILQGTSPIVLNEIGFLERETAADGNPGAGLEDVGKIDHVLVHPNLQPLKWCALEMQAVYFSGATMSKEFNYIRHFSKPFIPFPVAHRRPDFRSSGPKRLMPQLMIKVPALSRWGKKMAVVVDRAFFNALGPMADVPDLSNADIAWFVVKFEERGEKAQIARDAAKFTTLENAVKGLTAGRPVSLETFEERIRDKLKL